MNDLLVIGTCIWQMESFTVVYLLYSLLWWHALDRRKTPNKITSICKKQTNLIRDDVCFFCQYIFKVNSYWTTDAKWHAPSLLFTYKYTNVCKLHMHIHATI